MSDLEGNPLTWTAEDQINWDKNREEMREKRELLEALKQAYEQLCADYKHSPLDGRAALLRKLDAVISKAEALK